MISFTSLNTYCQTLGNYFYNLFSGLLTAVRSIFAFVQPAGVSNKAYVNPFFGLLLILCLVFLLYLIREIKR